MAAQSFPSIPCVLCENCAVNPVKLTCDVHYACRKCINSRGTQSNLDDLFSCTVCGKGSSEAAEQPPATAPSSVYIFMDHSNTWIEAKKLDSKQLQQGKENNLIRVDVGQLLDVIVGNRDVATAALYGSEPPPVDSVWQRMGERGWKLDIKERSQCTNKEKKVDTQITSDATEAVCVNSGQDPQNNILVLISGDSDMIPVIEKAKERKWQVEVYTWKHAVSNEIKNNSGIKVCYLDDFEDKILFTSMKFPIAERPELLRVVRQNGLVCTMEPNAFGKHKAPSQEWCQEIQKRFRAPFRYFRLEADDHDDKLCLVFEKEKPGSDKIEQVIRGHKKSSISKVYKVQTYLQYQTEKRNSVSLLVDSKIPQAYPLLDQYCERQLSENFEVAGFDDDPGDDENATGCGQPHVGDFKPSDLHYLAIDEPLTIINHHAEHGLNIDDHCVKSKVDYKELPATSESHHGATAEGEDDNDGCWNIGKSRPEIRKKKQSQCYSSLCPNGKDCRFGLKCKYKHTEGDKKFFRNNRERKLYHKTKPCTKQRCPFKNQPEKCNFAHGPADAVCLKCHKKGHFTDSCK